MVLSGSYEKTAGLLARQQVKDAHDEVRSRLVPAVKKIFSEAATVSPERFGKTADWNGWVKGLYMTSVKAERALAAGQADEAGKLLESMRGQFYDLHRQTETVKAGDLIYGFRLEARKAAPSRVELKVLREMIAKAELSRKANTEAFAKARQSWTGVVDPILKGELDAGALKSLREATDAFYAAYGQTLE